MAGKNIDARSAGLAPAGWIAESTLSTLAVLGYPSEGLQSKGLDAVRVDDVDIVVSLLGDAGLNFLPPGLSAQRVAWQIRDPFGEDEETYLSVARLLEDRVQELLIEQGDGELLLRCELSLDCDE